MSLPEQDKESTAAPIRILMIDDDSVNSTLAKGVLERHGCAVQVSSNPMRALEKFSHDTNCADIVLLDYFMPTLDGGQTVHHLRKLKPDIKVVLFSGAEEIHLRQIMKQFPIDAYVHKPLRIDEALSVIRKLAGKSSDRVLTARTA